ncbi:hypothetical protein IK110_02985 [Candidatus Saccharibacteria bacterium]|nr:hypothetical protein [Candidatus Saccharibacteria bacterium]
MDQNNTATPDELQQAINNITNPADASAASVEAAVAQATGAAAPAVDLGVAPAPEVPGLEAAPAPAKAVYGDPDLDKVKSMALSDLRPILESVEIEAGKKFKIYKEIIDLTEDKACIELAYNAAKGIEDQKEKAEALLFVVEAVDKLGIPAEQAPAA